MGASSLGDIGERSRADVVWAATFAIVKTLELASPVGDAKEAARHVFQHVKLKTVDTSGKIWPLSEAAALQRPVIPGQRWLRASIRRVSATRIKAWFE